MSDQENNQDELKPVNHESIDAEKVNPAACSVKSRLACIFVTTLSFVTLLACVTCFLFLLRDHRYCSVYGCRATQLIRAAAVCLPCDAVRLSTPEENAVLSGFGRQMKKWSQQLCCARNYSQTYTLLSRYVDRVVREKKAKGELSSYNRDGPMKYHSYAHLLGKVQSQIIPNTREGPPLQWIYDKGSARTDNLEHENGYIIIRKRGLYYVYTKVQFTEYQDQTDRTNNGDYPGRISLKVVRSNILYPNRGEETLLQTAQTRCYARDITEQYGYVGAVLFLRREDRLAVKVSDMSIVSAHPKMSYFGVLSVD